jgi:hypothetical protein
MMDRDPQPVAVFRDMRLRLFAPLLLLFLGASADPEERVVSGYYRIDWEVQEFRPCGGGSWWVANPGPMLPIYRDLVESEYGTVFVRVRVDLTEPGRFGHMGQYRRSIAVLEVLDARLPSEDRDDCSRVRETD